MADDKPIIDFGNSQRDLQLLIDRLKIADGIILKISQDALTAGRNLSSITLPSDLAQFTAQNQALTAQIQAQSQALSTLQIQYNNLSNQRRNSSQRTAEETVNQGILNRNALESARINSTLAGAYARLSAEQSRASRNLQDLVSRGRLATQTQREYDREIRTATTDFNALNTRILAADRAVGRFNRNVGNYPAQAVKGLKDLLSAFGLVGGVQLFATMTKNVYDTTKEIQSMDMALRQVTGTNETFAESQMFLSRIAEAYGSDLGKLTTQFTQFYVSAKDKLSGNQIENIFESITKAGATMGLSTQQQERAFLALNQMMSKGTIQAEELRGQLGEALPGALGIMAKSLGVTEVQLGKMMKDGQLLASDVLPKFARQLEITYGIENVNRIETLAAAQGRYTNAWRDFVRGLDEDGNKLSSFMKTLTGLGTDLLIGVGRILESSASTRNRILKTIREQGYSETIAYYKKIEKADEDAASKIDKSKLSATQIKQEEDRQLAIKAARKKDIENDRDYNINKAKQETAEYTRLQTRNLILKAIASQEYGSDRDKNIQIANAKNELKDNLAIMKSTNELLSKRAGQVQAVNKLLDEGKKTTSDNTELTKAQLKAIEDALKAQYNAAKKELELRVLKQETILNGEFESYDNQYKALEKFLDLKMQIIKLDYNEQVRLAKGNKDKIRAAEIDAEMATIRQMQDGYSKTKVIRKKQNDEYIQEIKDVESFLKQYHEDQDIREQASQEIREKVDNANKALYDKQIERLKELKQATKDYLSTFSEEFASNSGFGETFNMFFKQIESIDKDGNKVMTNMFKQLWEGADTSAKKFAVAFNAIGQTVQETFNFISASSTKNFDAEKERLQAQYDVSLKYAGDNKAAQEKLADDLEKKKKEIDYREAKAKQKQALFNVAIDTAQAVVSAVAESPLTFGLPWSAFALALGLAQAAVISSQEIPRYFKGGTHAGGLMMVNDGEGSNYKETILYPNGKMEQPQGRNVIMDAPAGTKIFTHDQFNDQLYEMMKGNGISMDAPIYNSSGISKEDLEEVMIRTIGNQSKYVQNINEKGFESYIEKGGNKTRITTNRGNSKGIKY